MHLLFAVPYSPEYMGGRQQHGRIGTMNLNSPHTTLGTPHPPTTYEYTLFTYLRRNGPKHTQISPQKP